METKKIGIKIFQLKWLLPVFVGETYNSWTHRHTSNIFSQIMPTYSQKNKRLLKYGE